VKVQETDFDVQWEQLHCFTRETRERFGMANVLQAKGGSNAFPEFNQDIIETYTNRNRSIKTNGFFSSPE